MKILFLVREPLIPIKTGVQSTATHLIAELSLIAKLNVCLISDPSKPPDLETEKWLKSRNIGFAKLPVSRGSTKSQLLKYAFKVCTSNSSLASLVDSFDKVVVFAPCYDSIFEHCIALKPALAEKIVAFVADSFTLAETSRGRAKFNYLSFLRIWGASLIEREILKAKFSYVVYVSRRDFHFSRFIYPNCRKAVVGIGVNNSKNFRDFSKAPLTSPIKLCFSGVLNYQPNEDAAITLIKDVFPLLPSKSFTIHIFGYNPTEKLLQYASPGIHIVGAVDDLYEALAGCDLFISCLAYGAGAKNKILAALSVGLPVIGTEESFSGLSTPFDAAVKVKKISEITAKILEFTDLPREDLVKNSLNSRLLINNHYSWQKRAMELLSLLGNMNG